MFYLIFFFSMMILNNNVFFSVIYCFVYVWKVFIISNLSSFLFGKIEGKLFIIVKFLNVLVYFEFIDDSLFIVFILFNEMVVFKRFKNL